MPAYDRDRFSPPAPVAAVTVRNPDTGASADEIVMVLDSGADISALPQALVDTLSLPASDRAYEVMAFDGSVRLSHTVRAEVTFQRGRFTGQFVVLDQEIGVLGRNILNHYVLTLDGPRLEWAAR